LREWRKIYSPDGRKGGVRDVIKLPVEIYEAFLSHRNSGSDNPGWRGRVLLVPARHTGKAGIGTNQRYQ
jgi:hypothetical protein